MEPLPLNDNELKELNDFLCHSFKAAGPMALTRTHGLFCAATGLSELIPLNRWESLIFGGRPKFDSTEQVDAIMQLLSRFYNNINNTPRTHQPFIFNGEKVVDYQSAPLEGIAAWCKGYLQGVALYRDSMSDVMEINLLLPFNILAGELNLAEAEKLSEADILNKKNLLRANLPSYIEELHEKFATILAAHQATLTSPPLSDCLKTPSL